MQTCNDMDSSFSIFRVVELRGMLFLAQLARVGYLTNAYKMLLVKPKRSLGGRSRRDWDDDIKVGIK